MNSRSPRWAAIGKVIAACVAGAGISVLYRMGLADIGGVLVLSAIIVSVITFVRSGALSASWLKSRDRQSINRLGHLELAKAFACAGFGIDVVRSFVSILPMSLVSGAIILAVAVVCAMGAGLFFVRWFAAYLWLRRR
jgi:hypothetical protein